MRALFSAVPVAATMLLTAAVAAAAAPERAIVSKCPAAERLIEEQSGIVLEDYGSFELVELPRPDRLRSAKGVAFSRLPADSWIGLRDYPFEAKGLRPSAADLPPRLTIDRYPQDQPQLFIVQFHGPVRDEWLDGLRRAGAEIIDYVPDFAYIVRARPSSIDALQDAVPVTGPAGRQPLTWVGPHQPAYRLSRALLDRSGAVTASLLLLDNEEGRALARRLEQETRSLADPVSDPPYLRLRLELDAARLEKLAFEPAVYWIEEWKPPRPCGEVGALNVAGQQVNGELPGFGLAGGGWLGWLQGKGFDTSAISSFVVNVTDTGLDQGNRGGAWHQDLYDATGTTSRVVYAKDWTADAGGVNDGTDGNGHGTNCAGVIGGFNDAAGIGTGEVSSGGYHFGLGVAPFVRLGGSKVFNFNGNWNFSGSYSALEGHAWGQGARISSNSWGSPDASYTADARAYDQLVRDASSDPGNQSMIVLFAAGNDGPLAGTVNSPGSAKNVITLAAAENWWPSYSACGWPSAMQDSPGDDIVYYSSRGPTADGRRKPDLAAIANGWNTLRGQFAGTGCGDPFDTGSPTLYRNFNGTSAATPAAAGAAALLYQWALDNWGAAPSPALVKAMLVATARDLVGGIDCTASDGTGPALSSVPNNSQGWGLVDIGRALDGTPAVRVDQTQVLASTGDQYRRSVIVADESKPVRIVLAFTDAPGNPGGDAWVNDLDLQVDHAGQTYLGNVLSSGVSVAGGSADFRNNLEVVILPAGTAGGVEITVQASNLAGDGVPGDADLTDQDFALYVYNANDCSPPAAPSQLSAGAPADNRIDLVWTPAGGGGITGQAVYRATVAGGPYSKIADLSPVASSYSDTTASGGTTYYYVVRSVASCESASSNEASALASGTCTAAPLFDGVTAVSDGAASTCQLDLSWSPATSQCGGQVSYRVYRSTTSGFVPGRSNLVASGLSGTSFSDASGLVDGTSYYYVVRAVDSVGTLVDANTVELGAAPGGPLSGPVTYSASDVPRSIPDNNALGTTSTLALSGGGTIADLQLDVNITHTYIGDLKLRLQSPIGTAVMVHNGSGGGADNLVTTYDSLTAPDGPGTMNDFDGEAISGNWKLNVSDNASFDTGTLNSWSLDVTTAGVCAGGPSGQPGEVSPAGDASWHRAAGSALQVVYVAGAASTDTTVYEGSAAAPISSLVWSAAHCNLGTSGSATYDPGTPLPGELFYFVAVANDGGREGSYGTDSSGLQRPDANGLACDYPQVLITPGGGGDAAAPPAPAPRRERDPAVDRRLPRRLRTSPTPRRALPRGARQDAATSPLPSQAVLRSSRHSVFAGKTLRFAGACP